MRLHPCLALLTLVLLALPGLPSQQPLEVAGLPETAPLALSASATHAKLVLEVALDPDWHLYGRDTGGGQPVEFEVAEDCAFAAAGAADVPMDDKGQITGRKKLTLPLRRVAEGGRLEVRFRFMACDPLMCLPPMEVTISGTVGKPDPLRVLLAVKQEDGRSERIAAFLGERGFRCTVVPYAEVTLEQCDSHDLVVADSPLFDDARGVRQHVLAFPKTRSPIVAVGFLGTELLEAHRIAMACGYI